MSREYVGLTYRPVFVEVIKGQIVLELLQMVLHRIELFVGRISPIILPSIDPNKFFEKRPKIAFLLSCHLVEFIIWHPLPHSRWRPVLEKTQHLLLAVTLSLLQET